MRNIINVLACFLISYAGIAQVPAGGNRPVGGRQQINGTLFGKLIEAKSLKPIEYASVQLIQNRMDTVTKKRKDVVVGGQLTKANGEFLMENVPVFGQYKLMVSVVGFKPYEQTVSFDIKPGGDNFT